MLRLRDGGVVIILAVDPGVTSGWCVYDSTAKRVLAAGEFWGWELTPYVFEALIGIKFAMAIERPKGQGPTRPQMVDCGYITGRLVQILAYSFRCQVLELYRYEVRKTLANLTHGAVLVRNDAGVWAALVLLHGEGSDVKATTKRKAGAIGLATGHARAALAVAVTAADRLEAL